MVKLSDATKADVPTLPEKPDLDIANSHVPSEGFRVVMNIGDVVRSHFAALGILLVDANSLFIGYYDFIHAAFQTDDVQEVQVDFEMKPTQCEGEHAHVSTEFVIQRLFSNGEKKAYMSEGHTFKVATVAEKPITDTVEPPKLVE